MRQKDYRYGIGPFWNFVNHWNFTPKQIKRLVFYIEIGLTAAEIFKLIKGNNNKTLAHLTESQVENFLYNSRRERVL